MKRKTNKERMFMLWENIQDESKRNDPEFLAEYMLGIVPCSEPPTKKSSSSSPTTIHNMVSTSVLQVTPFLTPSCQN